MKCFDEQFNIIDKQKLSDLGRPMPPLENSNPLIMKASFELKPIESIKQEYNYSEEKDSINEGSNGKVYKAIHQMGGTVAVKVMQKSHFLDEGKKEQLQNELYVLARITHP